MPLTQSQLQALKADINANTATVDFGGQAVQIKDLPNTPDANFEIALWYSLTASPDYWVWRSLVSRSEVYHTIGPTGTTWNWGTYKGQAVAEQNAWAQMFMGDSGPIGNLNFRAGIKAIFTGSAQQNAQRDHCFAVGRRPSKRVEKLLAAAVVAPPADTGNDTNQARGSAANPDNLTHEGGINVADVTAARNLP